MYPVQVRWSCVLQVVSENFSAIVEQVIQYVLCGTAVKALHFLGRKTHPQGCLCVYCGGIISLFLLTELLQVSDVGLRPA